MPTVTLPKDDIGASLRGEDLDATTEAAAQAAAAAATAVVLDTEELMISLRALQEHCDANGSPPLSPVGQGHGRSDHKPSSPRLAH